MDTHKDHAEHETHRPWSEGSLIKDIAGLVVAHALWAWILLWLTALATTYFVGEVMRDRFEQERLSILTLDAERRSIELMSQTLNGNQMGAIGLLGLIDDNAKLEALNVRTPNSKDAADLMELIGRAHDADGVYIVGRDGIIKSSWGIGKPLTGVDVKFRPYAQMAFKGQENVYAAIGTTTGRRNLYYAAPLYADKQTSSPVIGAVVMRTGVVRLDKLVAGNSDVALLLSPQRIAFAASNEEWIGLVAGQLTPERIREIRQLKQFGALFDAKEPSLLPFNIEPGVTLLNGTRHAVVQAKVAWNDPSGDWTLVVTEDLSRTVPMVQYVRFGLAAGLFLLLLGWVLSLLLRGHYRQVVAAEQLATYARMQRASAERKAALANTALQLQQAKTPAALVSTFLREAHCTLGVLQGVVYLFDAGSATTLHLAGSYACANELPARLVMGEGLLGQCAIDRHPQILTTAPDGFGAIRSGLGGRAPAALLMTPILLNDVLLGVLEVALLTVPGDAEREQFEVMIAHLAMNLEIVGRNEHTAEVLGATLAAERAGAEQLAFQQALVDTIPYPVFYKGADNRFLGVNRAYEETFNIQRNSLVGKSTLELDYLPEVDRLVCQAEDETTIASAGVVRREMRLSFADGKVHETLYYLSAFRRQDGSPGGLVGTFIDIGAIKDAERELERLADAERFNRLAQGREQRILELKQQVNTLSEGEGSKAPYATTLIETTGDHEIDPHPDYRTTPETGEPLPHLSELIDIAELQTLFTSFCESVGIAAAIVDLDGVALVSSSWQRACTDFHRINRESCARCIESDTELALKRQEGESYAMYTCKNGMTDCTSPIIIEGQHLANVFIGQFHLGSPDIEFFREQAKQFGYPEADYLQAISEAPIVDEKRLPVILGFLGGFARLISTMSLARRRADAVQQRLEDQAELLRKERLAAMSLAEDNAKARQALAQKREEQ